MIFSKPLAYALGVALVASLVWGGWNWVAAKDARSDLSDVKAEHARVLKEIADKTAETEYLAGVAQNAYHEKVQSDALEAGKKADEAFERGRQHGLSIAAGTQRVRTVWRDRECAKAASGEGAGSASGASGVDPGRAEAIGAVLGLAGSFDATYDLAYGRLKAAQGLLNACYDESREMK